MNENRIAIVVCGIKNHIPLLEKLRHRGFYTILVDGAAEPIAKESADEFVQIDIFDFEGIKRLAIERKASLIINACQEHINSGICKISEELNLPHPYSYETALDISDKVRMKAKMKEYGIPTTNYTHVSSFEQIEATNLRFPVYVKSCVGSGSNAVNRATDKDEVKAAVLKALKKYPGSEVIIEEEARGEEYNVYCFPENGKPNVLLVARRYTDNLSGDRVTKLVGTLAPALISEDTYQKIEVIAKSITDGFNLDNVPMFMQVMIEDNEINVIEFAGRMAGGFGYQTIMESTGVDWFEATINGFLRLPNNLEYKKPDSYITVSHVYGYPCVYGEITGWEELLENGIINNISFPKKRGMEIKEGFANSSLVVYLIHKDKSLEDLMDKISYTFAHIEFLDINGEKHLNKRLMMSIDMIRE